VERRRHPSIERRLLLWLALLHAAALAIFAVAYAHHHFPDPEEVATHALKDWSLELAHALRVDSAGGVRFQPSPVLARDLAAQSVRYAIVDGAGAVTLASSLDPPPGPLPDRQVETAHWSLREGATLISLRLDSVGRNGKRYRIVVALPAMMAAGPALIWDELKEEVLPLLLPLLGATILVVLFTVRRMLLPLRRLSQQATEISGSPSGLRLETAQVPREILPLVSAVNGALAKVEEVIGRQRRFAANAAHELRTPLAVLSQRIDAVDVPEHQAEALRRDVARMARIVDQLLTTARLDTDADTPKGPVDLVEVARDLLADMAPLARAEGKEVGLSAPDNPVLVRGNALELAGCLRNLIDNGLRFTPANTEVTVTITPDGKLNVRDHGPGVPTADRRRIFEPFWRGAGSTGAGLGLAIVAETLRRCGGAISVADAPGGGALFRVELPVLQTAAAP
jgi:signal transduction histidine kinase